MVLIKLNKRYSPKLLIAIHSWIRNHKTLKLSLKMQLLESLNERCSPKILKLKDNLKYPTQKAHDYQKSKQFERWMSIKEKFSMNVLIFLRFVAVNERVRLRVSGFLDDIFNVFCDFISIFENVLHTVINYTHLVK